MGKYNVAAQEGDRDWAMPINLSRSGSTDAPVMVVDQEGIIHVVWRDAFVGQVYAKRVEGEWSIPKLSMCLGQCLAISMHNKRLINTYQPLLQTLQIEFTLFGLVKKTFFTIPIHPQEDLRWWLDFKTKNIRRGNWF
ncbi:MAG: hypothetical protein HC806_04060 [Anaerolineae bacterium]|nr:hypothetical protein [Anaerolineae bacterium]